MDSPPTFAFDSFYSDFKVVEDTLLEQEVIFNDAPRHQDTLSELDDLQLFQYEVEPMEVSFIPNSKKQSSFTFEDNMFLAEGFISDDIGELLEPASLETAETQAQEDILLKLLNKNNNGPCPMDKECQDIVKELDDYFASDGVFFEEDYNGLQFPFVQQQLPTPKSTPMKSTTSTHHHKCCFTDHKPEDSHSHIAKKAMIAQLQRNTDNNSQYFMKKGTSSKPETYKGQFNKLEEPKFKLLYKLYVDSIVLPSNISCSSVRDNCDSNHHRIHVSRTRYIRGPDFKLEFDNSFFELKPYERSNDLIYEPEYYRVQVVKVNNGSSSTTAPINQSRCGLCPYCADIKFFELRNSAYGQHLAYHHGIGTDAYLTPDPFSSPYSVQGRGRMVQCPTCYQKLVVGKSCTTSDTQPLYTYLRHFKDKHRKHVNKLLEGRISSTVESFKGMKLYSKSLERKRRLSKLTGH